MKKKAEILLVLLVIIYAVVIVFGVKTDVETLQARAEAVKTFYLVDDDYEELEEVKDIWDEDELTHTGEPLEIDKYLYSVGEGVHIVFPFCSTKRQKIYGEVILKNSVELSGMPFILPVDDVCNKSKIEVIRVPNIIYFEEHDSPYILHGDLFIESDGVEVKKIHFYTNEFEIKAIENDTQY